LINNKGKDTRVYTRLPMMTPEFRDKLNSVEVEMVGDMEAAELVVEVT